ncbi:ARM repeat superfamily protein [Forsythia ovata]|uniref:ARM repeat superfamily protein n=1 Tax=Forsythia ovata TaxID=205694 RepID=A0ABD1P907_9LAMI
MSKPLVTRRIIDGLNGLCLLPFGEVSIEILLDLLCSLITPVSTNDSSVDSMTFTTRLLDSGMKIVYSLNRQIYGVKLPGVFSALKANGSEAVANVFERFRFLDGGSNAKASEIHKGALKFLYVLDALKFCLPYMYANSSSNILKSFKSLLEMRKPLVTRRIIDGLNDLCLNPFREGTLESLAELLKLPDEDFPFTKHLSPVLAALLANASEAVTNVFERFHFLDGGSNAKASEIHKGALKFLYVLDALKFCLPYMYANSSGNILKSFKSLLMMMKPLVTRRIIDGLNDLCLHPFREVSIEILLDFLCLLITSVFANDSSSDSMTFTIRLLDSGMKRVYSLNRQICVVKLPGVFSALKVAQVSRAITWCYGSETFLNLLPLKLEAQNLSEANLWLFPILKRYVVDANLSFFTKSILPMVSVMKRKSTMNKKILEGKVDIPEERAIALYALQVVDANLHVLRSSAREIQLVSFASISDKEVVTRIFNRTIKKLLKVTHVAVKSGTSRNSNVMQVDDSSSEGLLAKTKLVA